MFLCNHVNDATTMIMLAKMPQNCKVLSILQQPSWLPMIGSCLSA